MYQVMRKREILLQTNNKFADLPLQLHSMNGAFDIWFFESIIKLNLPSKFLNF